VTVEFQPELYPIDRVLIAGPLADARPLADRAVSSGHSVALLLPDEEIAEAGKRHRVLAEGEAIAEDDFDLVLELHCADLESKAETLLYVEDALGESTPILTLTLAISAGELARETMIPERVAGICLLPPFEEAKLVEIMPTLHTNAETLSAARRFFVGIGMETADVADSPGGVLARTVCCIINEAAFAVQDQISSAEDVDQALRLAAGHPRGPLSWGDRIGLDGVLTVMEGLYAEFKEERYRPAPLLKRLVRAGHKGARTGTGFFSYAHLQV
jgi:3-hydroxybutyryl-CoA dehydrogenase